MLVFCGQPACPHHSLGKHVAISHPARFYKVRYSKEMSNSLKIPALGYCNNQSSNISFTADRLTKQGTQILEPRGLYP